MPPELIEFFRDFPLLILFIALAAPFFVLIGVIISGIIQRLRDKGTQGVAEAGVAVSETEAETRQFQAIIDGFTKSLEVVEKRAVSAETKATAAEAKADSAEGKANKLSRRVRSLEDERHQAITHVLLLEALIPYPPGPPERPLWMHQLVRPDLKRESGIDEELEDTYIPEKDN